MSATVATMSWWWKEHLPTECKHKINLQSKVPKERMEDIRDEDEAGEEGGLEGDRLSVTTTEH